MLSLYLSREQFCPIMYYLVLYCIVLLSTYYFANQTHPKAWVWIRNFLFLSVFEFYHQTLYKKLLKKFGKKSIMVKSHYHYFSPSISKNLVYFCKCIFIWHNSKVYSQTIKSIFLMCASKIVQLGLPWFSLANNLDENMLEIYFWLII
jgi:Ca2+/Na+ antiporter